MAPVKKTTAKTAAKKTAAKKPAAKKTAAKKTAVKKTAAKKPAAKKTTAKPAAKKTTAAKATANKKAKVVKTTAKKQAVKKVGEAKTTAKKAAAPKTTAVKKTVAKTAEAKTTVKTAVEKKPVAKTAEVKTAVKTAEVKTAVKTAAVKKTAPAPQVDASDDNTKYRNLFDAFVQGKLPFAQGYIVSSFLSEKNAYSIYEIVSYAGVKEIFPAGTGLTFVAGGKKLYVLVEHDTYQVKYLDPVNRAQGESIPKRFNELEILTAKNQTKIMVAKEPNEITGSFTILKPASLNFAVIFYQLPEVYQTLASFFEDSLNRQRKVPQSDAKKAGKLIADTVEKTMGFKGEFE